MALPKEYTEYLQARTAAYGVQSLAENDILAILDAAYPDKDGKSFTLLRFGPSNLDVYYVSVDKDKFSIYNAYTHEHKLSETIANDGSCQGETIKALNNCISGNEATGYAYAVEEGMLPHGYMAAIQAAIAPLRGDKRYTVYVSGQYARHDALLLALQSKYAAARRVPEYDIKKIGKINGRCIFPLTQLNGQFGTTDNLYIIPGKSKGQSRRSLNLFDIAIGTAPLLTIPLIDQVLDTPALADISWRTLLGDKIAADSEIAGYPAAHINLKADLDGYQNIFLSVTDPAFKTIYNRLIIHNPLKAATRSRSVGQPATKNGPNKKIPKDGELQPKTPQRPTPAQSPNNISRARAKALTEAVPLKACADAYTHFIMDTNVMYEHCNLIPSIIADENKTLLLPATVHQEVNAAKDNPNHGQHAMAKKVYSLLNKIFDEDLSLEFVYESDSKLLPWDIRNLNVPDNRILAIAVRHAKAGHKTCVISSDGGMLKICEALAPILGLGFMKPNEIYDPPLT